MENREFFIPCDGLKVHAKLDFPTEKKEKYPLLVIIHGLTGHMEEDHIIATAKTANEEGFASLRVEMFGHGKSDGEFKNHTVLIWMTQAMRIIEYARKLDFVSKLYLAGHSQGGLTSVLTAGTMGDMIDRLIPMSPAMVIIEGTKTGEFLGQKINMKNLPESVDFFDGRELSSNYLRAARVLPVEECIAEYKKPVYLIHGTEDELVPYSCSEVLLEKYENATLLPIEEDDHCYTRHLDLAMEALRRALTE